MIDLENSKEEKEPKNDVAFIKELAINIVYSIIIVIYLICFYIKYESIEILTFINISSIVLLGISIVMIEIAYRKDNGKIFISGIEILALAIFTLLMKHITQILGSTIKTYIRIGLYSFVIYYILKMIIIYTREQQNKLKSLSDIKEIVKDEPIKKATKRKNKKVEEGK